MNKLFCYYEPHIDDGYTCEYILHVPDSRTQDQWLGTFVHMGNFDSLYAKCEALAKANNCQLESLMFGLPPINTLT